MSQPVPDETRTEVQALLDAVGRAMGARRAFLLPVGLPLSRPAASWWRRRGHPLSVEVPDLQPPRQLIVELTRPPTAHDRAVLQQLVRAFGGHGPEGSTAERRPVIFGDPRAVLQALGRPPSVRVQAVLDAIVQTFRLRSASVATVGADRNIWVSGPGRPVLRTAALEASEGPDGRVEVLDRRFLALQLRWEDDVVGGLALEDGLDGPELRGCVALLSALLGAEAAAQRPPIPIDTTGDLDAALSVLPMPALAVDADGNLLGVSPEASRVFSLSDFDIGRPLGIRLENLGLHAGPLAAGLPAEITVDDHWYEPVSAELPSGGRLVVLLDRGAGEEASRSRDELVAAMSHELRTPIAGVKALLEVLRLPASRQDPERVESFVGEGIKEITRLERLVEDLLLSARVATGGIQARPDRIRIRPVVEDVIRHLEHRYPDRHLEVHGDTDALADPALLRHVVWHLIDNGAKFGPSGGRVTVEVADTDEGPEIHVCDEGPGIFSGDLPELFQPFRRLERNTSSAHGGAGIGLYLVKAVVQAQGGKVWVRSRLGKGSTFIVRLPAPPS